MCWIAVLECTESIIITRECVNDATNTTEEVELIVEGNILEVPPSIAVRHRTIHHERGNMIRRLVDVNMIRSDGPFIRHGMCTIGNENIDGGVEVIAVDEKKSGDEGGGEEIEPIRQMIDRPSGDESNKKNLNNSINRNVSK